jgi:hypothetical protein
MTAQENKMIFDYTLLISLNINDNLSDKLKEEVKYINNNFCGSILNTEDSIKDYFNKHKTIEGKLIFFAGNIDDTFKIINDLTEKWFYVDNNIHIIEEISTNYEKTNKEFKYVNLGMVPININNVGIYFRNFFNHEKDYYNSIINEHQFQNLTESNKPGNAHRKGIYITKVSKYYDETHFNLLRCSTNLDGPTDNCRTSDNEIIDKVNDYADYFFSDSVKLNHVLAQLYVNTITKSFFYYIMCFMNYIWMFIFGKTLFNIKTTEKKAKIIAHSDKTKDMPKNAIMAFCTFYEGYLNNNFSNKKFGIKKSREDSYDYKYKDASALTRLFFKLKPVVKDDKYVKEFTLTLYPNSVFIMALSTNRLYTHEIRPSTLPIKHIPTRLGYVIRCSNTKGIHKDGQTYILRNNEKNKLNPITKDDIEKIKKLYFKENTTADIISYNDINCSMNKGDYKEPML